MTPTDPVTDGGESPSIASETFEVTLRSTPRRWETTIPKALSEYHGFEHGDHVAFTPVADGSEIEFDLAPSDEPDRANVITILKPRDQTRLRWPKVLADEREFWRLEQEGEAAVEISTTGEKQLRLATWPPTRPWSFGGEPIGEVRSVKHLQTQMAGPERKHKTHRLELPVEFTEFYDRASSGESVPVAVRLTLNDGQLALALDFDIEDAEKDRAHIRKMWAQEPNVAADTLQLRVVLAKAFVDALRLDDAELRLTPYKNHILVERA